MDILYNYFMDGAGWIGGLIDDVVLLTFIAASVLCGILIFQILMTVIALTVKRCKCGCAVRRVNGFRRGMVLLTAWGVAIFMLINIITYTQSIADITIGDILLPIALLVAAYILELFFSMFTTAGCCLCKTHKEKEPKEKKHKEKKHKEKKQKPAKVKKHKKHKKHKHRETQTPEAKIAQVAEIVAGTMEKKFESAVTEVLEQQAERVDELQEKIDRDLAHAQKLERREEKHREKEERKHHKHETKHEHKPEYHHPKPIKTVEEIFSEKRNERIEELGAKIERQRQRAEKTADKINDYDDTPISASTREARHTADETANKMDALQRRMDALRKTVTVHEVRTVEHTNSKTTKSKSELQRERDRLKFQYETLQNRLEQIKQERVISENRAKVGYYSDAKSYERTGHSQTLGHIPSRNKFDEDEVKSALQGLKTAMEDLQRQIDQHNE
jgi:hypothetical protein